MKIKQQPVVKAPTHNALEVKKTKSKHKTKLMVILEDLNFV
jgi:hypothetical protein